MIKNIKRTFASIVVATAISFSVSPVLAGNVTLPPSIYETKTSQHLSSGTVHESIMRFTSSGWWNINVLRINLLDEYTDIKGLVNPSGIPNRSTVSSMVEKSDAIAGINGDYFNYSPLPSAMGTLINDGEIISSPIERSYALPTFFLDALNNASIQYANRHITVKNSRLDKVVTVNTINKVTKNFDTVTLLNKHWGSRSVGNRFHKDLIEVVVDNDTVIDVRKGQGPTTIPENGYVLAIRGERLQDLDKFLPGDEVKLHASTTPDSNDIKFAIGGGSIILQDGKPTVTNIHSAGNHPRTGIGISQDGKELILVTVDGRSASFKGIDQKLFGALLKDLGAHNGLNLDGGGSTTMAIKPLEEEKAKVVNKPSEGVERSVVNGVGVFSNAPVGDLSYLKLSTNDSNMFIDTTRRFSVKGYDENHNPVPIDEDKLEFSFEGVEGEMEGNVFKAGSSGKAKITAHHEEVSGSIDINILGTVRHLSSDLASFNIDLNSKRNLPEFTARDKKGYTAKVDPRDLSFTSLNDIGYVEDGVFHSKDTSVAGALTARLGEGVTNILVSVGSESTLIEGFENLNNFEFTSYPKSVEGKIELSSDIKEGSSSLALKYDFSKTDADTRAAYLNFKNTDKGLAFTGTPRKLGLWVRGDNQGSWLRGTIKDSKGKSHTIDFVKKVDFDDWRYVDTSLPADLSYPIALERVYLVEIDSNKKHSGEILIDGLTASYPPTVGTVTLPTPSSLKDDRNTSTSVAENGFTVGVAVEPKGLNDIVKYDASSKVKERFNKHNISVFLGGSSADFQKGLTSPSKINANSLYSRNRFRDLTFLNINTSKKGIRSTDSSQWTKLKNDLSSIETNNLVLFLSSPVFGQDGFDDKLEADLLHTLLGELVDEGKKVFLVHGGNSNTTTLRDGIRYIGLNTSKVSKPEDIYNLSMVEFVVNDSEVTYEINPIFPKPQIKTN